LYEIPYNVTGVIKLTGSKKRPTGICKDKIIGTWKTDNVKRLHSVKRYKGNTLW